MISLKDVVDEWINNEKFGYKKIFVVEEFYDDISLRPFIMISVSDDEFEIHLQGRYSKKSEIFEATDPYCFEDAGTYIRRHLYDKFWEGVNLVFLIPFFVFIIAFIIISVYVSILMLEAASQ